MTKSARRGIKAVLAALLIVVTACGGQSVPVIDASGPSEELGPPRSLEFLGDLVVPGGTPIVEIVDADGAMIEIGQDAHIVVPAGAFPSPTEVTARVVDIDFEPFVGESPFAKAYVVSTEGPVALASPVVIEVSRPAQGMQAVQLVGDEIATVPVLGDATSRVEIHHFSEVGFLMFEAFAQDREALAAAARAKADEIPQDARSADASFLTSCIAGIGGVLGLNAAYETDDIETAEYISQLAVSVCTSALVRRTAPSGSNVSTQCVGDQVSLGLDFRQAVAECANPSNAETADGDVEADDIETADTLDDAEGAGAATGVDDSTGDNDSAGETTDAAPAESLVSDRLGGEHVGTLVPSEDPDREIISGTVELSAGDQGLSLSVEQIYTQHLPLFEKCNYKTHRVTFVSTEVTRDTDSDLWFEGTFLFETIDKACGDPSSLDPRVKTVRFQQVGNELIAFPDGLEEIRIPLD